MYPKQATRPEFAKFDRNTATNRRGAGIRNGRDALARNVSRYWLSQNWKMSQQGLSQMKFLIPLCYPTVPAFCGVDSNATTPQIIAAFRVKFRLNRQKVAKLATCL